MCHCVDAIFPLKKDAQMMMWLMTLWGRVILVREMLFYIICWPFSRELDMLEVGILSSLSNYLLFPTVVDYA